jgi:prophage tail gpP-like protein
MTAAQDIISIRVNGVKMTGWTDASVSAGITRIPRQGVLQLTRQLDDFLTHNGTVALGQLEQPCQVYIGDQIVITGYICIVENEIDEDTHRLTYEIRGVTCDLVDSTAEFYGSNTQNLQTEQQAMTVAQLIANIAKVYSIDVRVEPAPDGVPTNADIQYPGVLSINIGDSAYTAVEQLAKYAGCLLYEGPTGKLVLGWPGSERASDTILTHTNVLKSSVKYDSSSLYSNYFAYMQASNTLQDSVGSIGIGLVHYPFFDGRKTPSGNPRVRNYRKIFDVAQGCLPSTYASNLSPQQIMAQYTCNRYAGQSQVVNITVYGWRDEQGNLWRPNQMVRIALPLQNFSQYWLITDCSYNLSSDSGTTTALVLMPKQAFTVEPTPIPQNSDVAALLQPSSTSTSTPTPTTGSTGVIVGGV